MKVLNRTIPNKGNSGFSGLTFVHNLSIIDCIHTEIRQNFLVFCECIVIILNYLFVFHNLFLFLFRFFFLTALMVIVNG